MRALEPAGAAHVAVQDDRRDGGRVELARPSVDLRVPEAVEGELRLPDLHPAAAEDEVIGGGGTVVVPTYPNHRISSYEWLKQGNVFDVRRTPSYTGILTEFARRQRGAVRSLHPTKSVCAIGPAAKEITATHHLSPYPYDTCSPYYKLIEGGGKIIGLGATTNYISFGYCVDDALKEKFPVRVYHDEIFDAPCIDYGGQRVTVKTYAHDMSTTVHPDMPRFMKTHISEEACRDLNIKGMRFFRANAPKLFDEMMELAKRDIIAYPRSVYRKGAS